MDVGCSGSLFESGCSDGVKQGVMSAGVTPCFYLSNKLQGGLI
jgi:hypothetical protein